MQIPLATVIAKTHLQLQERRRRLGLKYWSFTPANIMRLTKRTQRQRRRRGK